MSSVAQLCIFLHMFQSINSRHDARNDLAHLGLAPTNLLTSHDILSLIFEFVICEPCDLIFLEQSCNLFYSLINSDCVSTNLWAQFISHSSYYPLLTIPKHITKASEIKKFVKLFFAPYQFISTETAFKIHKKQVRNNKKYDSMIRLAVAGDGSVGKSALCSRFASDLFVCSIFTCFFF